MLDYSPTKTQKLLGNPDKPANPTASSPACAGLAGEHCTLTERLEKKRQLVTLPPGDDNFFLFGVVTAAFLYMCRFDY